MHADKGEGKPWALAGNAEGTRGDPGLWKVIKKDQGGS